MKLNKNINWLASYPKSGNTWLRILLTHYLNKEGNEINLNHLITDGIASNRDLFEEATGMDSSELTNSEIDNYRPWVYQYASANANGQLYFKIHDANHKNEKGEFIIPTEVTNKVIYLIRNPLDVAVSFAFHSAIDMDTSVDFLCNSNATFSSTNKVLALQLRQKIFSWSEHIKSWANDSRLDVVVIKYEDLLQNTMFEFEKIVRFLDLPVDKSALLMAVENSTFEKVSKMEKENGFREKPLHSKSFFRNGKINDWQNYLTGYHVERMKSCHFDVMKKYGYL